MTSAAVGFQKLAFTPRLTGAALGGALGFAASPEDEGQAAGLTGAALGYGAGALADRLHKRVAGTPAAAGSAAPKPPVPAGPPGFGPEHMAEVERALDPQHAARQWDQQFAAHQQEVAKKRQTLQQLQGAKGPARKPLQQQAMGALSPEAQARVVAARRAKRMPKIPLAAKVGFDKLANIGIGTNIGPVGVNFSERDERLPGMNRWVPRETLEQAYQGLQQGLDQQALLEQASASNNLKHPAVGAGLAAALARFGLPALGMPAMSGSGTAVAALAGGGLGALYNRATTGKRQTDMKEAIKGVQGEQARAGGHQSAREATPMVVSGAGHNL